MKAGRLLMGLAVIGLLAATGVGFYQLGLQAGKQPGGNTANAPSAPEDPTSWTIPQGETATRRHIKDGIKAGDIDPLTGRKVLYYHDPMVPGKKFAAPGKSPFMEMMLVPAYAGSSDGGGDAGDITVSPRIRQNIGLRTAEVVRGKVSPSITASGTIAWNEQGRADIQARALGYVEEVYVRSTLEHVSKGQALVKIHVPDWVAVQEEFLSVRQMRGNNLAPLVDAARARMRQAGMAAVHIRQVETSGRVQPYTTLTAPLSGIVTELAVQQGMTLAAGMTLLRINSTDPVWADAEIPESQTAMLQPGTPVTASTPALPGARFTGKVQALLPEVSRGTRTLKARLELANPDRQLVAGMFVQMELASNPQKQVLLVPSEALIHTGKRSVVMLAEADGHFRPTVVETGREADGQTEVLRGLEAGQRVVLSGQFLIDSEASLKGLEARLNSDTDDNANREAQP
jgi:Cu(I)/Ag(I) efflux system membrane fusion protein